MKVFAVAGSLRKGSWNRKLLRLAADMLSAKGHELDIGDLLDDLDMPHYNADVEDATGYPPGAREMARRVTASDAMMVVSPEFSHTIPGVLKNAIDWLSHMDTAPLRGRSVVLLSASPSLVGGNRGLWQTRIPFETCGTWVHPDMFSLARSHLAFEEDGTLKDQALAGRLDALLDDYLSAAAALNAR